MKMSTIKERKELLGDLEDTLGINYCYILPNKEENVTEEESQERIRVMINYYSFLKNKDNKEIVLVFNHEQMLELIHDYLTEHNDKYINHLINELTENENY